MVAIIENRPGGFILAWRQITRPEYRDGLQWITETCWALRHLGWGTAVSGRIIGNDRALEMMAAGHFNGGNLCQQGATVRASWIAEKFIEKSGKLT